MRYLIVAVGLVALFPLTTAAQSIEGVWQRTEIVFAGWPATVRSTQPGLSIITDTHIATLEDNGQALRTTLGLIRFRGHILKGGYDVHDGRDEAGPAGTPAV